MKNINFFPLLEEDPLAKLIIACWANDLSFEEFEDMVNKDEELKNYHYSQKQFELIHKLIDEQLRFDMLKNESTTTANQQEKNHEQTR